MRVLITGARGLIGEELVTLLLQKGVRIHYLTTSRKKIANESLYKGFYWDPKQGIIDENCLMAVDAIIHLAGATISKRWTKSYKQEIIESRILSSNLLFKILKNNPNQVQQIVSASAIGIYPDSLTNLYTEDYTDIDDSFLSNVILKWEQSIDKFKLLNIKVSKLRTGLVLSKKGGFLPKMIKPIKLGIGAAYGTGKQKQSWIHIHDLVAMYYFAVKQEWEGIYNAVAPNSVDNKELISSFATALKRPFFMPNYPKFLVKLIIGEMHILLFESQNVSAEKVLKTGFQFKYKMLSQAVEDLII